MVDGQDTKEGRRGLECPLAGLGFPWAIHTPHVPALRNQGRAPRWNPSGGVREGEMVIPGADA
jgi:hypothetical protein